jgi:hypothetical protein
MKTQYCIESINNILIELRRFHFVMGTLLIEEKSKQLKTISTIASMIGTFCAYTASPNVEHCSEWVLYIYRPAAG